MVGIRKTHPLQTKVEVAIEAIKGEKTASEITSWHSYNSSKQLEKTSFRANSKCVFEKKKEATRGSAKSN
jgi:hypothetical protein